MNEWLDKLITEREELIKQGIDGMWENKAYDPAYDKGYVHALKEVRNHYANAYDAGYQQACDDNGILTGKDAMDFIAKAEAMANREDIDKDSTILEIPLSVQGDISKHFGDTRIAPISTLYGIKVRHENQNES